MHVLTVLIPTNGSYKSFFDPRDHQWNTPAKHELTALCHKGMTLFLFDTKKPSDEPNPIATKMVQYLTNPCAIYTDIEFKGDALLQVVSSKQEALNNVIALIDEVYNQKDSGTIPEELKKWCLARKAKLQNSNEAMKAHMISHIDKSLEVYGKHIELKK